MNPRDYIRNNQTPIKHVKVVVRNNVLKKALFMFTVTKDGSMVFDPSPYFTVGNWRWGMYEIPPGRVEKDTVSMLSNTKQEDMNNGPKFTYHKSGWVTVGKTGHHTSSRILATPFATASGHIFTLQIKGFEALKDADTTRSKYVYLGPMMPDDLVTLKIVASIGKLEDFVTDRADPDHPHDDSNIRYVKVVNGQSIEVALFRIILDSGDEKWLMLEFWPNFPYNVNTNTPSLSLLTGWIQEDALDKSKPFRCLGILGGHP